MYDHLRMNLPKKPPVVAEVECPSCGTPRANDTVAWLNPETGQLSAHHDSLEGPLATAVFLGITAIVAGALYVLIGNFPFWQSITVGAVAGFVALVAFSARLVKREAADVRVHRYKCVLCDHEWTWREGTPRPRYRYREQIMEEYEALFGSKTDEAEDRH